MMNTFLQAGALGLKAIYLVAVRLAARPALLYQKNVVKGFFIRDQFKK
jgi:hypothetical protein